MIALLKKYGAYGIIVVYAIIGLLIVGDYGVSTDEPIERTTSLVNYNYAMRWFLARSESENVQNFVNHTPELHTWVDRHYGATLHLPLAALEHLSDFTMPYYQIFFQRHIYNFLTYIAASLFFFWILKKRFSEKSVIPILGLLMFILTPRFFGEAFYNNKDILFYSWYIIAVFFALRYLEKQSIKRLLPFAAAAALATNTRIIGLTVVMLVFAYIILTAILEGGGKTAKKEILKNSALLIATFFGFYTLVTPFMWRSPIGGMMEIASFFTETHTANPHFFMGQTVHGDPPWYYIPVWMGVTVPVGYILLFAIGCVAAIYGLFVFNKNKIEVSGYLFGVLPVTNESLFHFKESRSRNFLYDSFFMCLFFVTLLGFIIVDISGYEGWRHSYFLYASFLYIAILGLTFLSERCVNFPKAHVKKVIIAFYAVIFMYLSTLGFWIINNHPHQFVFFNEFSRGEFMEENFALDYWYVSHFTLLRHMLTFDQETFTIAPFGWHQATMFGLRPHERERVFLTDHRLAPEFRITGSRFPTIGGHRVHGYDEIYTIIVDGAVISALHRYKIQLYHFDQNARFMICNVTATEPYNIHAVFDGNPHTEWRTPHNRRGGEAVTIRFTSPVQYNLVRLNSRHANEVSNNLQIFLSSDRVNWRQPHLAFRNYIDSVMYQGDEFQYIRLENLQDNPHHVWNISEIMFGNIDPGIF